MVCQQLSSLLIFRRPFSIVLWSTLRAYGLTSLEMLLFLPPLRPPIARANITVLVSSCVTDTVICEFASSKFNDCPHLPSMVFAHNTQEPVVMKCNRRITWSWQKEETVSLFQWKEASPIDVLRENEHGIAAYLAFLPLQVISVVHIIFISKHSCWTQKQVSCYSW